MSDYAKMYCVLFNAITDALERLSQNDLSAGKEILIAAQQKTEALYIETDTK